MIDALQAGAAMATLAGDEDSIGALIKHWRDDPTAAYRTWFRWEDRFKNFRSIRRGVQAVTEEIRKDSFGNS